MSRIRGVQSGSGPSSKVRATRSGERVPALPHDRRLREDAVAHAPGTGRIDLDVALSRVPGVACLDKVALSDRADPVGRGDALEAAGGARAAAAEAFPDQRVLRAKAIDADPTELFLQDEPLLVREGGGVEKPNVVIDAFPRIGEPRPFIGCRIRDLARPSRRGTRHDVLEGNQLRFAVRWPVVAEGPDADDPLARVAVTRERVQPFAEPGQRGEGTGFLVLARLVIEHGDEAVDMRREGVEVEDLEVVPDRDAEPEFQPRRLQLRA